MRTWIALLGLLVCAVWARALRQARDYPYSPGLDERINESLRGGTLLPCSCCLHTFPVRSMFPTTGGWYCRDKDACRTRAGRRRLPPVVSRSTDR